MKLFITGYHNTNNFGDILMLQTFLSYADKKNIHYIHEVNQFKGFCYLMKILIRLIRQDRSRILKQFSSQLALLIFNYDRIVLCGGTHFQEYENRRYIGVKKRYYFFKNLSRNKIPIDMIGIGINKLSNKYNIYYNSKLLEMSDITITRDEEAIINCKEMRVSCKNVKTGSDIAFASEHFSLKNYQVESFKDKKKLLVSLVNRRTIKRDFNDLKYIEKHIYDFKKRGWEIRFFLAEKEKDMEVLDYFKDIIDSYYIFEKDIQGALEYIGESNLGIVERYHVLLSCSYFKIPCLVPIYNRKTYNLLKMLGRTDICLDLSELKYEEKVRKKLNYIERIMPEFNYPNFERIRKRAINMLNNYFDTIKKENTRN